LSQPLSHSSLRSNKFLDYFTSTSLYFSRAFFLFFAANIELLWILWKMIYWKIFHGTKKRKNEIFPFFLVPIQNDETLDILFIFSFMRNFCLNKMFWHPEQHNSHRMISNKFVLRYYTPRYLLYLSILILKWIGKSFWKRIYLMDIIFTFIVQLCTQRRVSFRFLCIMGHVHIPVYTKKHTQAR
jgi:hypothetical protein